jgi:hypothetical protein
MGGDDGLADGQTDTHALAGIRALGIVIDACLEQILQIFAGSLDLITSILVFPFFMFSLS